MSLQASLRIPHSDAHMSHKLPRQRGNLNTLESDIFTSMKPKGTGASE